MKFNELTKTRRSVRGGEKPDLTLKKKTKMSLRFCETCRQEKPKNALPHVKGWQCTDCILLEKQNDNA
jgi:hypothetical protein